MTADSVAESSHTVLIIEDDADIRETLYDTLKIVGYQVFTAANGREGLDLVASIAKPCVIFLDLMMPIMNGWEFARAIEGDPVLSAVPVVVVTAYADRIGSINAAGVLKKPFDLDQLLLTTQKWCGDPP